MNMLPSAKKMTGTLFSVSKMAVFVFFTLMSGQISAKTFPLPPVGSDVVGSIHSVRVGGGMRLSDIAQKYDVGFDEMAAANPKVKSDTLSPGKKIVVPELYILPDLPWKGIIINLAEMRLYYFPPGTNVVKTFPVGIGREGSETPLMSTRIIEKKRNPSWRAPASVKKEVLQKYNIKLPKIMPPGPDNPLGKHMMRLGLPNYLIHGTNQPWDVGRRVSAGCIRMYPNDVEQLFSQVRIGTAVQIIHQAYKAGWKRHKLYLEAHVPLREHGFESDHSSVVTAIKGQLKNPPYDIDWSLARKAGKERLGVPVMVGLRTVTRVHRRSDAEVKKTIVAKADVKQHGLLANSLFRHSWSQN